ncbi:MAG: hypothetical protein A3D87_03465 [Omnitrophica WOR_2 bacterium RIFCSPHIGHO2_02_FULL_50_17]|nr:MAG: hypothetical protein A3D87_03465 [Omnitrophica WOR_2 bacterium RIFCSPHIGHO2_02_FULL_50_17]
MFLWQRNVKFDGLNILRSVLALGVIWHHMYPPILGAVRLNVPGRILVWLFFSLSGYVISKSFYEGNYRLQWISIKCFYLRRVLRIIPLLYVSYFSIWFLFHREDALFTAQTFRELLFLQYDPQYRYVSGAWFICPLIQLYLVFPLLFLAIEKFRIRQNPMMMLLGLLVLDPVLKYLSVYLHWRLAGASVDGVLPFFDDRTLLGNLGPFLWGAVIYPLERTSHSIIDRRGIPLSWLMIALGIIGVCSLLYQLAHKYFWVLPTSTLVGAGSVFLIAWCNHKTAEIVASNHWQPSLVTRFLLVLGPLSYGVFLWHDVWIERLSSIYPFYQSNYAFFILGFMAISFMTILASGVTYCVVEVPFSKLRKYI